MALVRPGRADAIIAACTAEVERQRDGLDRLADVGSVHLIAVLNPRTGRVVRVVCRPEVARDLTQPGNCSG